MAPRRPHRKLLGCGAAVDCCNWTRADYLPLQPKQPHLVEVRGAKLKAIRQVGLPLSPKAPDGPSIDKEQCSLPKNRGPRAHIAVMALIVATEQRPVKPYAQTARRQKSYRRRSRPNEHSPGSVCARKCRRAIRVFEEPTPEPKFGVAARRNTIPLGQYHERELQPCAEARRPPARCERRE